MVDGTVKQCVTPFSEDGRYVVYISDYRRELSLPSMFPFLFVGSLVCFTFPSYDQSRPVPGGKVQWGEMKSCLHTRPL